MEIGYVMDTCVVNNTYIYRGRCVLAKLRVKMKAGTEIKRWVTSYELQPAQIIKMLGNGTYVTGIYRDPTDNFTDIDIVLQSGRSPIPPT